MEGERDEVRVSIWSGFREYLLVSYATLLDSHRLQERKLKLEGNGRPEAFRKWINGGRSLTKSPAIDAKFTKGFVAWYRSLQPAWRQASDEWPMSREVPVEERWEDIAKGGKTGFFVLLVGLCWWRAKAGEVGSGEKREQFDSVLEDVRWVLGQIGCRLDSGVISVPSEESVGAKRPAEESETPSPRKRT